jgi:protein-disulfide isomerase
MHDAMFEHAELVGAGTWDSLARIAQVPQESAFLRCMKSPGSGLAVDRSVAAAREAGATGTPMFAIDGRFYGSLRPARLRQVVDSIQARALSAR